MERELELPDVGEGIAEGEIVQWLVGPGDTVTEDQPVAEVETDKAVVEVPSPINGTVKTLHAAEGEIVEVDSVIVTFEVGDGAAAGDGAAEEESTAPTTEDGATSADEPKSAVSPADNGESDTVAASATAAETTDGESVPASQVIAPPRVKRLARELGVDIGALAGAADGTRITETVVRRAAGEETTPPTPGEPEPSTDEAQAPAEQTRADPAGTADTERAEPATGPPATNGTADREKTLAAPATRQLAREHGIDIDTVPASEQRDGQMFVTESDVRAVASGEETSGEGAATSGSTAASATASTPAAESRGGEERIPYRGIRRTIGKQMEEAKYNAPHVSHHDEVDVTELQQVRRSLNEELGEDRSLTYMPFVMKAVVRALGDHPAINSTLDTENGEIVQKHYYNLGVATATDAGLMVPVVRDVGQKGLVQLAEDVSTVVERARNREISPSEMQDGTFTITNFGAIGGDHATPIINYPEAAILGLGAIKKRPSVIEDEVKARTTLPLSLTVDHRLIDGAVAASFTNDVKHYLNNPELLML
jgi:pyruvate dehydrogenase E2 component (dihydrolipoamide acetyltransferase)